VLAWLHGGADQGKNLAENYPMKAAGSICLRETGSCATLVMLALVQSGDSLSQHGTPQLSRLWDYGAAWGALAISRGPQHTVFRSYYLII